MEGMDIFTNLVGSLGFPIFTALYFMTKMEKHLQKSNELMAILIERNDVNK
jgi:hypothetical protein